MATPVVVE
uniref:Uncharacterized protein n=1 Tax=Anguilla anguilla TaxID=7936 RepID=A0A0E9S640_ANGAN